MCHNELGPGTEYDLLAVLPVSPRKAVLRGSVSLIPLRTRSRETLYPLARNLPKTITSPISGKVALISLKRWRRLASLIASPISSMLNSLRLR